MVAEQISLFHENQGEDKKAEPVGIGNGLSIKFLNESKTDLHFIRNGSIIKKVTLSDKVAKRLFVIEAVEQGAIKAQLAKALEMSRQSIHNYEEMKKHFGMEGLINGYSPQKSKSRRKQREDHRGKIYVGNKAGIVAQIRKKEREQARSKQQEFEFSFLETGKQEHLEPEQKPFAETHGWEKTRYAGVFIYIITLVSEWNWLKLITGYFGPSYRIMMTFLLMVAHNTRSIEQLKNVRSREAGVVMGIGRIGSRPTIWKSFYLAADKIISRELLIDFFRYQIRKGIVGCWQWFTDGHLLPYSGHEKIRSGYHTQRRMPFPGQTNLVTCDGSGRVVDFQIQEGKGDLRSHIVELSKKWGSEIPEKPIMVFDREGSGIGFFSELVLNNVPFVTWEKNAPKKELSLLDDSLFCDEFEFNGKQYSVFEGDKILTYKDKNAEHHGHTFVLRRIYIWNKSSGKRVCGIAWPDDRKVCVLNRPQVQMDTIDCAKAILSRWGASENTFKHQSTKHPMHYHPGFKMVESQNQIITNPEIKVMDGLIKKTKKALDKLYKKLAGTKQVLNKDGKPRDNSIREKIKKEIDERKAELNGLMNKKKQLPGKVDVSTLEDYRSFKKIDNEGKNLFDFVMASGWNARKQMVDWLRPFLNVENELVDLFYAISNCHGWIKSTNNEVIVRLEPLEQTKRRRAQEQLCRKLSGLCARTTSNKLLVIEVGPPKKLSKNEG